MRDNRSLRRDNLYQGINLCCKQLLLYRILYMCELRSSFVVRYIYLQEMKYKNTICYAQFFLKVDVNHTQQRLNLFLKCIFKIMFFILSQRTSVLCQLCYWFCKQSQSKRYWKEKIVQCIFSEINKWFCLEKLQKIKK